VPDPRGRAAVLGRPIGHSLSPALHRAAYAALGLNWTYDAIDCGVAELAGVLAERADWAGFSCTMPLKRAALESASSVAPMAAAAGAANTLLPTADGWRADNTDVVGIIAAVGSPPRSATIIGAGGTAQAAVVALSVLGVRECAVLVRDVSRTDEVRASAAAVGLQVEIGSLDVAAPALDADLVISTVPAGAADPLAARAWRPGQTLLDAIYAPWPTPVAAAVAAAGGIVRSGALMLLHQAAAQVQLMTGRIAPVDDMRAALRLVAPDAGI
jgi:shikimate dehydrogenase